MRKKALWEQREETPVETRAHSSEAAFPSVTDPYTSRCTAYSSAVNAVHPSRSRRPRADADVEDVANPRTAASTVPRHSPYSPWRTISP